MVKVEPKVYYLSFGEGDAGGMEEYLLDNNISWRPEKNLSWYEALQEFAGRLCYESWVNEDGSYSNKNIKGVRKGNEKYLENIINSGHGSVFEHGGIVLLFNNVSRVFTHELVRHRQGTAFSQTSGRYVRLNNIKFWVPGVISENPEALKVFEKAVLEMEDNQSTLEQIYDIDNMKDFDKKKKLSSAFRRIAPIGLANNILFSANPRSLYHILNMRTSEHAEIEIQEVFRDVAERMKVEMPNTFQGVEWKEDGSVTAPKI